MTDQKTVLLHTVLISFHETISDEARTTFFDTYQNLGDRCGGKDAGILYFQLDHNLDLRKNVHLAETMVFTDETALKNFAAHDAHKEMGATLREIADWQVADVLVPSKIFTVE